MSRKFFIWLSPLLYFLFPLSAFAHEAYVLTRSQFQNGLKVYSANPLGPLLDRSYIGVTLAITASIIVLYTIVNLWSTTDWSAKLDRLIKKADLSGPLIIRAAIGASFFYAAQANCVLGPELSLTNIAGGDIIRLLLYVMAFMVFFGVYVEVAAFIGIVIFIYILAYFNLYMITYLNYLGELIVLFLFGSRILSFDSLFFGKKLWFAKLKKYAYLEVPIVRMFYGLALMYAGWTIKFEHQALTVAVYNEYHLNDFFHASANFIAAGAGLSEILIGFFIFIGFSQRLTILISLIFITLSLLYFRELIWPHLMLYAISFSLIINSADKLSLERYLIPWAKGVRQKFFRA